MKRFTKSEIMEIFVDTRKYREIANAYNCSVRSITNIKNQRQHKSITEELKVEDDSHVSKVRKRASRNARETNRKLSDEQVLEIYLSEDSSQSLSERFNISIRTVYSIRAGITWADITSSCRESSWRNLKKHLISNEVVAIFTSKEPVSVLAERFNVCKRTVINIQKGRTFRRVTLSYEVLRDSNEGVRHKSLKENQYGFLGRNVLLDAFGSK